MGPTDPELSQAGDGACVQTGSRGSRRQGISCCPRRAARWKRHKSGVSAVLCQREWDSGRFRLKYFMRPDSVRVLGTECALAQLLMLTFCYVAQNILPVPYFASERSFAQFKMSEEVSKIPALSHLVSSPGKPTWMQPAGRPAFVAIRAALLRGVHPRSYLAQVLSWLLHKFCHVCNSGALCGGVRQQSCYHSGSFS